MTFAEIDETRKRLRGPLTNFFRTILALTPGDYDETLELVENLVVDELRLIKLKEMCHDNS